MAAIACVVLAPSLASAQAIGGTVTDTTGGVLPGVTVEARSPALIEQVRTVTTDGAGRYLIVALEPGTYSVTFRLSGFSVVVREEIQLRTGFTATIDTQLSVGDIQESVTITGATPVVDIQNVHQRQVVDREIIDTVPTGKSFQAYALLVPGMVGSKPFGTTLNQDAGGLVAQGWQTLGIHGGMTTDQDTNISGMSVSETSTRGLHYGLISDGNYEEMSIEYAAHSAEVATGGVRVNVIPREGSNTFSGSVFTTFTFPDLQADNLDQALRDRGLRRANQLDEVWLVNPSVRGPIIRDRLWFFAGHTTQRADLFLADVFHNRDPAAFVYVPDISRPSIDENLTREQSLHLTWQATSKDKVKVFWSNAWTDKPHSLQGKVLGTVFVAPEAAIRVETRTNTGQVSWFRPQSNRLLVEAGLSFNKPEHRTLDTAEAVTTLPGIFDVPDNLASRNMQPWLRSARSTSFRTRDVLRGSVSYVTGSHSLKVGLIGARLKVDLRSASDSDWIDVITLRGRPLFANFRTHTRQQLDHGLELGVYAQEQWTLKRLTVNTGVRFDRIKNSYPDQVRPASRWAPEPFSIEGQTAVIWTDIQPRLGVVYDLFGDKRTAVKASASRYGQNDATIWAAGLNPAGNNALERRSWVDLNGDGFPQGDPLNPAPNGELSSPRSNPAFGQPVITTFYDKAWAFGWGNRFSNWEISGSVQRELMPNLSLDVGYFRRDFVNFAVKDDRAVGSGDFDQYTISVPTDPRLPGGGGFPVTLVDIKQSAFGRRPDEITTHADTFGGESRTWNGFDVTVNARRQGFFIQGGLSTGKTAADFCSLQAQVPEILRSRVVRGDTVTVESCGTDTSWLTQVKLLGSYALPYGIQVAGTYQSLPGPERGAQVTFTSDQVIATLGRPLAGGGAVSVDILEPGTVYGERSHQVDVRLTKIIKLGNARLRAMMDIFNVFNANAITNEEYGFGPNYLRPLAILPGRLAKFAFQLDF
jgi:hypothetical protein